MMAPEAKSATSWLLGSMMAKVVGLEGQDLFQGR